MELTEVLEFSRADMTRIVSQRLKEDREKRGTTVLLKERVALKKKINELEATTELLRKELEFLRYQAWLHDYGP
jgi:dynactin complex subunit